ncbi:DNA replication protein, partial [Escherichia coli]
MGVVKLADYRHNPVQHQEASSMGYVSIHRQFMDSRLYKDSQAVHLWLHLILKANHESTVVNTDIGPITVDRGQMITGRPSLVRETFIPDNKVRSLLRTFESKGMLNICSMGKKFSLFTIVKYDDFQAKNCPTVVQRLSNANTSNGAALSGDCPTVVQRLSNANTSNGAALSGDCPT